MESQSVARERWEGTPEYTAKVTRFHQIGESITDAGGSAEEASEAQSNYWKGASSELDTIAATEYKSRIEKMESVRVERDGQVWRDEALRGTQTLPPAIRQLPEFQKWFSSAVESFNAELVMGHHPDIKVGDTDLMHSTFKTIFGQRLVREPSVKAVFAEIRAAKNKAAAEASVGAEQAKRDKVAAAATAVQDFKEGVSNSREVAPPNPLGALGPGSAGAVVAGEPPPDAGPDTDSMLPHELKKFMRKGARGDASRRLNPT